ncbi:F-box domain-containing protein [Colletotrichum orchidophilum]|uniref:F-box domain-containing protein n=1 Tax=Colletotrichum orchidophilum TaxID=1209926 RepID=A0A1G4AWN1_9PEZI|nr:F-box domain-containing protein [Colletotrichum orchidophilum]OHE93544.1 F-box domain-containing protein [Colletotrichum orchidophilum]
MSPRICSCTLCGWVVVDAPGNISWLNQFRGLSSSSRGVILTGVGLYDDPGSGAFIAPVDPNRRWDDSNYDSPEEDQFGAMGYMEVNGRHGFIFHEACWDLLEIAFRPGLVPLLRLFDVCDSLPFPLNGVSISWGHDYGGPVFVDDDHHFPWEDRFSDREYMEPDPVFSTNPYEVQEVQHVLTEAPESPPSPIRPFSNATTPGLDRFHALPEELRSVIAIHLPTVDVLNLRLASRPFWTIFNSQQFWASRFKDSSDRSWLFESQDSPQPRDWRWLYRRTNNAHIGPGFQNRVRVWNLAQKLVAALDFRWIVNDLNPSPEKVSAQCIEVSGELWEHPVGAGHALFNKGCLLQKTYRLAIPESILRLSVWSIPIGDMKYVAGLKFTTATGDVHQIGYRTPAEQSVEISDIRGFKLAVGERGIQALQCISERSGTSHWVGSPEASPKTLRLDVGERLRELDFGFDGCKIVSLAVSSQVGSPAKLADDEDRLRKAGIWYPAIPGPNLCLNEASFPPREHYLNGYKPLFWTSFGGPGGIYLRNLTNLSVIWGACGIRRVDFAYDITVPPEHRAFGCEMSGEWTKEINFAIDGAGGEFIDAIEVFQHQYQPKEGYTWMVEEGVIVAFKVSTNRGRSCFFSFLSDPPSSIPFRVTTAPGQAITGFYGSQRPHDGSGISALGIISEVIKGE